MLRLAPLLLLLALQDPEPETPPVNPGLQVVVLVNEALPESVSIGEYYAQRRAIPKANICRVRTSTAEICKWSELRKDILEPLKKFLEDKRDVLYIVPVWGIPVKTEEENSANDGKGGPEGPVGAMVTGRDYACIDREIELLKTDHDTDGWMASKVFKLDRSEERRAGKE